MKKYLPLTALACCLLGPAAHAQGVHPQRADGGDESSAANIKRFYHYYILEVDKTLPLVKFNEDTLRKYCTALFLKNWHDEHGYDRMIKTNEYYIGWAKNNTVVPLNHTENNEYRVCLLGPLNHCIIVTVKKEDGKYKISSVRKIE